MNGGVLTKVKMKTTNLEAGVKTWKLKKLSISSNKKLKSVPKKKKLATEFFIYQS